MEVPATRSVPRSERAVPSPAARFVLVVTTAAAAALAAALAVRAVWWAPLNVDEELTRRIASEPLGTIFHVVSTQRGGGPLHFWLEHFTLRWPGGLVGLRVPSLLFLIAALPAIALVSKELAGTTAAACTVLLTAAAPLAIAYSTFGRPHTLLLAWIEWGTACGVRAARRGRRIDWLVAGAVLGSSVFVHPTAPLYALVAFTGALLLAPRPPRVVGLEAWPGALALAVTLIPYYVKTLGVLSERYGVGSSGQEGRAFGGEPVWHAAVHAVSPGAHLLNWFTALALGGLSVLIVTRRIRVASFLALTLAAPILFFTYVPANGRSAVFFDRYMLPALPSFMLLVAVACTRLTAPLGRARVVVLAVLIGLLLAAEGRVALTRQRHLGRLELGRVAASVRDVSHDSVLFASMGSTARGGYLGSFTFGRPPFLLDRYVSFRVPSLELVDDDTCVPVVLFLAGSGGPRHGIWLFYAARRAEETAAAAALSAVAGVRMTRPAPHYFLVRSSRPLAPRALVELGLLVRRRWRDAVPANPRVGDLLEADEQALSAPAACRPHGPLGDPDISPHFPDTGA